MEYGQVVVKKARIASIERKHPWIFSGGVISHDDCVDGDIVEVRSPRGDFLAMGYFQDASIMVRILAFEEREIDQKFWNEKISQAIQLRKQLKFPSAETNAYRLIHGEGDGLPGLIIDMYAEVAVIQCHAIGMHMMREQITQALKSQLENIPKAIFVKSGNTLPRDYALEQEDDFIEGKIEEVQIKEHGAQFIIDIVSGQKTGFFLDQRENRKLLQSYAQGKTILNLFSYTGGFSIYGLQGGAKKVVSVDVSAPALEIADRNAGLTKMVDQHESIVADVNSYLKEITSDHYDIIVVDPPAFAKSRRKTHNAVQAYKRVNAAAIRKVKSGGLIFTFSCSQVIDATLFYNTITAAAIEARRPCQVIHHLSQGPDHPVSIFHPEGKYLKGLVLRVE